MEYDQQLNDQIERKKYTAQNKHTFKINLNIIIIVYFALGIHIEMGT